MKKYQITLTENHLRLITDAVEDWHRFLAGQCDMHNAISRLDNYHDLYDALTTEIEPLIAPNGRGSSYGWDGGSCSNEHQRKAIAMSYGIYRQILHYFAMERAKQEPNVMNWNVYTGTTLTCPEQGGLIKIKEIKEEIV